MNTIIKDIGGKSFFQFSLIIRGRIDNVKVMNGFKFLKKGKIHMSKIQIRANGLILFFIVIK